MRKLITTLFIWMICFIAITSSVVLIYQWHTNRGVEIKIHFDDASGLVPAQSKLMYLGVQVGMIQDIIMDPNSSDPVVIARISKQIARMLGPDSKFWIVSPQIGLGNISNLSTISTGDYIALQPVKGKITTKFKGLEDGPVDQTITHDLEIKLTTINAAGISVGSPILFRGVQIGKVSDITISKNLRNAILTAYIDNNFKNVVRANSRFANASGFHASLHLFGASKISMDSFKTLISGGIDIFSSSPDSPPAKSGQTFTLLTAEQLQEMKDD